LIVLTVLLIIDLSKRGVYSGKMGINLAVVGDSGVSLLLLRPEEEMLGWVKLPKGVRVKVYNSEGVYPLESLWSYGVSEKKPYDILEKSLGQSMGVVISRTVKISGNSLPENVLGNLLSLRLRTNLSIRDRLLIRQFIADAVRSKKVLELSVPSSVFDKVTDPDGKEFLEFNLAMGLWTKNKFIVEPVFSENADVSINNISGVVGAGSILSNQLESAGMHVTEVKADTDEVVENSGCVYYSGKKYEMTESILREQLDCRRIAKPDFVEEDDRIRIWIK